MQAKDFKTNHERFGELSALALTGQLSPAEHRELRLHLESCTDCRAEYDDFETILSTELPLLHEHLTAIDGRHTGAGVYLGIKPFEIREAVPSNIEQAESVPHPNAHSRPNSNKKPWLLFRPFPRVAAAVFIALIGLVALLSVGIYRHIARERSLIGTVSRLNSQVIRLQDQIQNNRVDVSPLVPTQQGAAGIEKSAATELAPRATLEAQLKAAKIELRSLKDELESTRDEETEISARASEIQERLAKTDGQLEAAVQERNQAFATIRDKQQELQAINVELTAVRDSVDRDRRLLAANRDIRDLMGARNLRIIDVSEVDGKGRTRNRFGRVFFTEGKSLVFYAFDLDSGSPSLETAAFQGWGSQSSGSTARSLGIFYRDDETANRWVLKFDNPQVLAEIDSVFITVEPLGGSRKPTGTRQMLHAYLKADLNHP